MATLQYSNDTATTVHECSAATQHQYEQTFNQKLQLTLEFLYQI